MSDVIVKPIARSEDFLWMQKFFREHYPAFVEYLDKKDRHFEIYVGQGSVGYVTLKVEYGTVGTIKNFLIHPKYRKQGIAQKAGEALIAKTCCSKYMAYISTKNLPSIKAALNGGFEIEGLIRDTTGPGSDYYLVGKCNVQEF